MYLPHQNWEASLLSPKYCHVFPLPSQSNGLFTVLQTSSSGSAEAETGALIQGLKHKLLVYLLKKKQQEVADGNREALKQFHYVFENYVNLLMWKVSYHARLLGWGVSLDSILGRQGLQFCLEAWVSDGAVHLQTATYHSTGLFQLCASFVGSSFNDL